jgi:DNA-binding transcriptional MerR regulator
MSTQSALFDIGEDPTAGFGSTTTALLAAVSLRQLDYWDRTGLVSPSMQTAHGSGSRRTYSFADVVRTALVSELIGAGIALVNVRKVMDRLEAVGEDELRSSVVLSDGERVVVAANVEDVRVLLDGGRGMFAVTPRSIWARVRQAAVVISSEADVFAARRNSAWPSAS